MNRLSATYAVLGSLLWAPVSLADMSVFATTAEKRFTTQEDFAQGSASGLKPAEATPGQLELQFGPPYVWAGIPSTGHVIKTDARTGKPVAWYPSVLLKNWDQSAPAVSPLGSACNYPSVVAVNAAGDAFIVNRGNCSGTYASITKYAGSLSACVDRNGNGVIDTSSDENGDGVISLNNAREFPGQADECILWTKNYAGVDDPGRSLVVDEEQNLWAAGHASARLYKINGQTGAVLQSLPLKADNEVAQVQGLAIGPGHFLYASDASSQRRVRKISLASAGGVQVVDSVVTPVPTSGISVDASGRVWAGAESDSASGPLRVDFTAHAAEQVAGGCTGRSRGTAVDAQGRAWVACWSSRRLMGIGPQGAVLGVWPLSDRPEGVSVDASGKIWLNSGVSSVLWRVDPAVAQTVQSFQVGTAPLALGDATGYQHHHFILSEGHWSAIHDSGRASMTWGHVTWNTEGQGAEPTGSRITVQLRAASTREALASMAFRTVLNNQPVEALNGRFVEVRVSLRAANFSGTPVLSDLTLYSFNHPPVAQCQAQDVCAGPSCVAEARVDNGSFDPDGESLSYSYSPAGPYSIGQRAVTLTVSDGEEMASCSAAVSVRDCEPPSIVCAAPASFECTGNESAQVRPAAPQAADSCSAVSVSGPGAAAYPLGLTPLTYQAKDAAGNTATCRTAVEVRDTLAPAITCPAPVTAECVAGGASSEGVGAASARDRCSAVVVKAPETVRVPVGNEVALTFSAQDTSGNRAVCTTPFKVEDTQAPTLTLKGQSLERLECGASFGDAGATASDVCAGDLSAQVVATGSVDPGQPGSYSVRYGVTDPSGHAAAAVSRTVVVEDTVAPVLALSGPAQQALECGDAHVDPGATASDVCAGDLTQAVVRGGELDPLQPGNYVLTYTVKDPSENAAAPVRRTVSVADTQQPVLLLAGASTVPLECGSSYVDPGAHAMDMCEGDLTSAIQVLGSVDAFTLGAQTLTYRVMDTSGNEAAPVKRVITVSDTQPPVVALQGAAQASLECGTAFGDPGASAHDACAGDLSGQLSKTGQVDTGTPGAYTLEYGAVDAAGNRAVATRTVTVTDSAPPVLQLVGPASLTQECATPFSDPSATAFDACLGDVSPRITVSGSVNTAQPGAYVLTYNASDTSGNTATPVQRTVQVTDSEMPSLVLKGTNPVALECNRDTYAEPGATAVDRCAGDLSASISIQGDAINSSIPKAYAVTYRAVDGAGNAATAVRTVRVQDTLAPSLVLKGAAAPVLECKASTFTDEGATAQDLCSGDLTGAITVTGSVNTAQPGAYPVSYRVQDGQGLWAEKTRNVRVADTRKPSITLLGSSSPVVECTRGTFVDPGATATDLCAGDLSGKIVVTGASKITGPGTYPITYNVKDPSGNAAPTVTRNVKVQDTTPPSLTVNGAAKMTLECKQDTYTELGATAQDACDGPLSFATYGGVNTQAVAVYSVQYQTHDAGHRYVSTTRTVEVVDRLPPTLTLKGPATLHHECASGSYTDPGATASDVCYGDLSSSVVIDHNVNAWTPATYQVTLNVQDGTGLKAPTLTRTVTVADTQAPGLEYRQVVLSPATHGMHTLSLDNCATANDRCDGWADINAGSIVSIYSDEPEEAPGDGDGATLQDIVITGRNTFSVRAERQSTGDGRVYGVNFTLKDKAGNVREGLCRIQVPATGDTAVDNGPGSGYTVKASAAAPLARRATP